MGGRDLGQHLTREKRLADGAGDQVLDEDVEGLEERPAGLDPLGESGVTCGGELDQLEGV